MPFGLLAERGAKAVTRELALRSVAAGFDFPTTVALEENGGILVVESGLPFGGASLADGCGVSMRRGPESCWRRACGRR